MTKIVRNIIIKSFLIHIGITLNPFRQFRLLRQVEAVCRPEWERESELLQAQPLLAGSWLGARARYNIVVGQ